MESDITSCGICYESYNEGDRKPLLLPCSHSFCKHCLQILETRGSKNCAFCQKSWGQTGVQNFPICYQLIPAGPSAQGKPRAETCDLHCKEITFWCESCTFKICNSCLEENHNSCKFMGIQKFRDLQDQKDYDRIVNEIRQKMSDHRELIQVFKRFKTELKSKTEKCSAQVDESQRKYDKFGDSLVAGRQSGQTKTQLQQNMRVAQDFHKELNSNDPTDDLLFHVVRAYQKSNERNVEDFIKNLRQIAESGKADESAGVSSVSTPSAVVTPFQDGGTWTIKDTTAGIKATLVLRTTGGARPSVLKVAAVNWAEEELLNFLSEISMLQCPVRVKFLDLFWNSGRFSDEEDQTRLQTLLRAGQQCTLTQFWAHLNVEGVKKLPSTVESVGLVLKGAKELDALKALNSQAFDYPFFFGDVKKKWENLSEIHFCFVKFSKDTEWSADKVWSTDGTRLVTSCAALDIQLGLHFPFVRPADSKWMSDVIEKVTELQRYSRLVKDVYLPGALHGADSYVDLLKRSGLRCRAHFPAHHLKDAEIIDSYLSIQCSVVWDLEAIHPFECDTDFGVPLVWKWIKDLTEPQRRTP